uniref:Uncharacterized protein n=1 Tax=Ananas comosus var. bracteatus TaxID=296719 RepID=A0A6V7PYP1_ANACO|nr:unnamed protein product [Ananas comosus var. bracteatus]
MRRRREGRNHVLIPPRPPRPTRMIEAASQYLSDFPSEPLLDSDVSFMNSVFELLLRAWASLRDLKVRLSSAEALGEMVGLITRSQLKAALPRLILTVLDLNLPLLYALFFQ